MINLKLTKIVVKKPKESLKRPSAEGRPDHTQQNVHD